MAFLHHHPRRSARAQLSSSPSTASLSQSNLSIQNDASATAGDVKDWSIVFPGRAKVDVNSSTIASTSLADTPASPFVSSPDEDVDASNVELALPNEQDGTGRFTRPSSPFYAADDEEEEVEELNENVKIARAIPRILGPPTVDSISEDESEFDGLEMSSSAFLSGSDVGGRRDSSVSHGQRRLSEWERGADGPSSSWSWMNAESSSLRPHHRGKAKADKTQPSLPVVFTSGSEGEEDVGQNRLTRRHREEEAAFEDALANTHTAQSAGLSARIPKRRHRKNGESAKGSKRSNSSAVIASDLRAARRRPEFATRRSAASNYSARDASRARAAAASATKAKDELTTSTRKDSRTQKLLAVVLKKLFSVDDDEVLQAFLRDEGPLRVEEPAYANRAIDTSAALSVGIKDEVWSRNERNRQARKKSDDLREDEEEQGQGEAADEQPREMIRLPPRGMDSSQMLGSPPVRIRLNSHVGEPSLLEAFQATVLSSLTVVPSGLSILLAGTRSVQLAQYLAGRIGPSFTERVRKLIDDAEDDSSIPDDVLGFESGSSITRFRGGSHPAISSQSSTTLTSRGGQDSHSAAS